MGRIGWHDLSSLVFGAAVSATLTASYAAGLLARPMLPARHQTHESLEIVHAIIGMLVAMIAILLGLQLDSATKTFAEMQQLLDRASIQIVQLDLQLRDFGPEAVPARQELATYVAAATQSLEHGDGSDHREQGSLLRQLDLAVLNLTPTSPLQSRVRSNSLSYIDNLMRERWELIAGAHAAAAKPLYAVLVVWLVLVYAAFGLNASFNVPVFLVLVCSALAIGIALFVLDDMRTPYDGLITVSLGTMRDALVRLTE